MTVSPTARYYSLTVLVLLLLWACPYSAAPLSPDYTQPAMGTPSKGRGAGGDCLGASATMRSFMYFAGAGVHPLHCSNCSSCSNCSNCSGPP